MDINALEKQIEAIKIGYKRNIDTDNLYSESIAVFEYDIWQSQYESGLTKLNFRDWKNRNIIIRKETLHYV